MEPERDPERDRRLAAMMMADLGTDRASWITGTDTKANTRSVDLAKLENVRAANVSGSREWREAQEHRAGLAAWGSVWKTLAHDGADDGKAVINDGQNHREWLLQQQAAERDRLAGRGNRGRGGRIRGGGRGGGVIGTRGRGEHRAFSSEVSAVPLPLPITPQPPRARGHTRPSRRRPSRASATVPGATSRQQASPQSSARRTPTAERGGRQKTAPRENFRGQSQLASPSAFMAAASSLTSRSTPPTQNLPSSLQPLASTTSRKPEDKSNSMAPVVTTNIPTIVEPEVLFSPEIDFAPVGRRVPTPPSARETSHPDRRRTSYADDLEGLDLSPQMPQEVEHRTERAEDRAEASRQSKTSTIRSQSSDSSSTILQSSQAMLDKLLKMNIPPSIASSISNLQDALRVEQLKHGSTALQSHTDLSSDQTMATSDVTKVEEKSSKNVVDQTVEITNPTELKQTSSTKNLLQSNSESVRLEEMKPTTRNMSYLFAMRRTSLAPDHEDLVNRVRDAIPVRGTLQDSEHSISTFHPRPRRERNRDSTTIIGEHNLPYGWRREGDGSQSSEFNTTASQTIIRHDTSRAIRESQAVTSQPRSSALDIDAVNQRLSQLQLRKDAQQSDIGGSSAARSAKQSTHHHQSLSGAYNTSELSATKPSDISPSTAKSSTSHNYQAKFQTEWPDATNKLKEERKAKEIADLEERLRYLKQSSESVAQDTSRQNPIIASSQASAPILPPILASAQTSSTSTFIPAPKLRVRDVPYIPDNASARQYSHQEHQTTSLATNTDQARDLGVRGSTGMSRLQSIISTMPSRHVAQTSSPKKVTFSSIDTITSQPTTTTPTTVVSPVRATVKGRGQIRAFESDETASSWDPKPEVRITTSPTRPRATVPKVQEKVVGSGVGASMWSNTSGTRGLGVSLGEPLQTLAAVTGASSNRGPTLTREARPVRSSTAFSSVDPDIEDTSALFARYQRPQRGAHQVPAFITASAAARQAADPGAAIRAQYGLAPRPVAGSTSRENVPMMSSMLKKVELEEEEEL